MHYILDNEGFIEEVSFGGIIECKNNTCSEYTGKVPTGYSSLEDWHLEANIRAYKIVDGDLVFDANKDYKLRVTYEREQEENKFVTRKELGIKNTDEVNPYANLYPSVKSHGDASYVGEIDGYFDRTTSNIGDLPVEEVTISLQLAATPKTGLIELDFTGDNMLPNNAINTENNGIKYSIGIDKTILISGTATEQSTLNLAGSKTSVKTILSIPHHVAYIVRGLPENVKLELYYYDGQDRILIGIYENEDVIYFENLNTTRVTQTVLSIESGVTIDATVEPRIMQLGLNYPVLPITKYEVNDDRYGQYYVEGQYAAGTYYVLTDIKKFEFTLQDGLRSDGENKDRLWVIENDEMYGSIELQKYDSDTIENIPASRAFAGYEEYRCNSTLIDLGDNTLDHDDLISIKDNEIVLVKAGAISDDIRPSEYIYLGDTPMPRFYTPYSIAITHQDGINVQYTYRDPRNIDMAKINLGNMIQVMNIENTYDFTTTDVSKVTAYINEEIELNDEELEMYDINGDGLVNEKDAEIITSMCNGEISKTIKGTLELNTAKSQRTIVLRDEEDKIKTSIGLGGITTPSLSVGGLSLNNALSYSTKEIKIATWIDGSPVYRKVINVGKLTQQNNNFYNHNIENLGQVIDARAIGYDGTHYYPIPFAAVSSMYSNKNIGLRVNATQIAIGVGATTDFQNHTAIVILEYTKIGEATEPIEPSPDLVKTISANGSKGHHKFTLQVNETSTSGNGSSMSYTFKLSPVATGYNWADWTRPELTISYTITIGGNTYTGIIPEYDGYSTVTVKSGSDIIIEHDADGSKTINIGFVIKDTANQYFTSGNASVSDTMILTKIS